MPTPDQQKPEPISKERFERAVRKLLQTPPKPNGREKPKRQAKSDAKPRRRRKA